VDHHDLARLDDESFVALCGDLLEAMLGIRFQRFGSGPDGGVDLEGRDGEGRLVVVQCKHWLRSPAATLVSHVRREERAKVERLAPARYLLVTSCDLTRQRKAELTGLLAPVVPGAVEVHGVRDLAAALRRHPEVVRRHPALWFSQAEALAALARRPLFLRARDLARDMVRTARVYVPGRSFPAAEDILERAHACVVSGHPGQGKTALAHALATRYAARGYAVVAVTEDTLDVDAMWDDDQPQVFVHDDFLTRGRDERRRHGATARLRALLDRVAETPDKRLVLTTRAYVLAAARQDDEPLDRAGLDALTVALDDGEYDATARAEILAHHAADAALPEPAKRALLGHAPAVVRHPGFSPALVVMALRAAARDLLPVEQVGEHLLATLDEPAHLWGHIVEHQLGDAAVDALAVLLSFGVEAPLQETQQAWTALRRHRGRPADPRDFRTALRTLDGTMVRRVLRYPDGPEPGVTGPSQGESDVGLANAAVTEFLARYVTADREMLAALLDSAPYFEQAEGLWDAAYRRGAEPPATVRAVAGRLVAMLRRTGDAPAALPWTGSPCYRAAMVADVAAWLADEASRALLREVLARLDVSFGTAGEDEACLTLLVTTLLGRPRLFDDEVVALLLPAMEAVDPRDDDAVHALAALVTEQPLLPGRLQAVVDATLRAALDHALAEIPPDRPRVLRLATAVARRGLDLPPLPGLDAP
jgi:hypothetical protein